MKKDNIKIFEKLLFGIPLSIILISFLIILFKGQLNLGKVNFENLGGYGSFIGGIVGTFLTIIATYYVYKTYHSQKKELKSQKKELILQKQLIAQQQFESTFFNMFNVHRELKNNLKLNYLDFFYSPSKMDINDVYRGVEVFEKISNDYIEIYNAPEALHYNRQNISNRVDEEILLDPQYLDNLNHDETNPRPLILADRIDSSWDENNNNEDTHKVKILFTFKLLYMNYQNILSHYCRNVYHILKFIRKTEEEDFYTKGNKKDKYKQYANIFQSQLNVNEHFILFYNFIYFSENDEENDIYFPMNLVNHYNFLENIGVNNLILTNHKKQYTFRIKGDN